MRLPILSEALVFPPPEEALEEGLLAVGGDLTVDRLLLAYRNGIFPWYNEDEPILWWSPDPRMVLRPGEAYVSKSMRKLLRDQRFKVTYNQCFLEVILACKRIQRPDQESTWITPEMVQAYLNLHEQGHATSVEVWQGEELVGGLYGVDLPDLGVFCGESMFSRVSNASKVAFITLSRKLKKQQYQLLDCQVYTEHLERMGAYEIPRKDYLKYLAKR
ncbi:leucyl/phenylalanyl-tRNA--protein transferase [Croceiramulus getboli]|nr:leucyl/phenylalanyl-tRNA--protein transferase [Flavobacteriaceae bacterium YJPT1-3]